MNNPHFYSKEDLIKTLTGIRTEAFLIDGCLQREMHRGNNSLDILNAMERLNYIKESLTLVGLECDWE